MENDTQCPICYEDYSRENGILKDSCQNHEIESNCKHWFCCICLISMYNKRIYECPLCREDIYELIMISNIDEYNEYDNTNHIIYPLNDSFSSNSYISSNLSYSSSIGSVEEIENLSTIKEINNECDEYNECDDNNNNNDSDDNEDMEYN